MTDVYAIAVGITGIVTIGYLEGIALKKGINGKTFATVVAAIAMIAGYAFAIGVN